MAGVSASSSFVQGSMTLSADHHTEAGVSRHSNVGVGVSYPTAVGTFSVTVGARNVFESISGRMKSVASAVIDFNKYSQ